MCFGDNPARQNRRLVKQIAVHLENDATQLLLFGTAYAVSQGQDSKNACLDTVFQQPGREVHQE